MQYTKHFVIIHTCNYHHADSEDLLVVSLSSHIAKSHARHAGHREVESRHIHRLASWPVDQFWGVGVVGPDIWIWWLCYIGQLPQPWILDPIISVRSSYWVPDARKPMRDKHIEAEQQYQHGGTVFQIAVQLANHATQA